MEPFRLDTNLPVLQKASVAIFACQPHKPEELMAFMVSMRIAFKVVLGSYKSEIETAFVVNYDDIFSIVNHGWLDEQESIMILNSVKGMRERDAFLAYGTGVVEQIGEFVQEPDRSKLVNYDGWTFCPFTESYFVVKPCTAVTH
jgi:hypothetical protein